MRLPINKHRAGSVFGLTIQITKNLERPVIPGLNQGWSKLTADVWRNDEKLSHFER